MTADNLLNSSRPSGRVEQKSAVARNFDLNRHCYIVGHSECTAGAFSLRSARVCPFWRGEERYSS